MRDFAISRCGDLLALQRTFLDALIAAQPKPGGWPLRDGLSHGGAQWYVATHAAWHVRGAICGTGPAAAGAEAAALPAADVELLHKLIGTDMALGEARGATLLLVALPHTPSLVPHATRPGALLPCRPAPWRWDTGRCCSWPTARSGGAR